GTNYRDQLTFTPPQPHKPLTEAGIVLDPYAEGEGPGGGADASLEDIDAADQAVAKHQQHEIQLAPATLHLPPEGPAGIVRDDLDAEGTQGQHIAPAAIIVGNHHEIDSDRAEGMVLDPTNDKDEEEGPESENMEEITLLSQQRSCDNIPDMLDTGTKGEPTQAILVGTGSGYGDRD
ncbi:hypothetical protein EV182_008776, partial [Spiromyces aspiralis]